MADRLYFFNSTAITEGGVPLPVSENEDIVLFGEEASFKFTIKHSGNMVTSPSGRFFLTTLRFIYVPDDRSNFHTFFVSLDRIFPVCPYSPIEFLSVGNEIGMFQLEIPNSQRTLFYDQIKTHTENLVIDVDPSLYAEDDISILPYYSDLCDG